MSGLESEVVAPQFVIDILQGAIKNSINVDELIGDIISFADLSRQDSATHITLIQYADIISRLTQTLDDDFIGMLDRPVPRRTFAAWCYAINGCKNLYEVVDYSNLFISLFSDQISWICEGHEKGAVKLILNFRATEGLNNRFMMMSLMLIPLRVMGWFINEKIKLKKVTFGFEESSGDKLNLQYLLNSELEFGASENCLIFDERYMTENLVSNYQQITNFLEDTRHQLLLRQSFTPFSYKVRSEIKENYKNQGVWLSLSEVAETLCLDSTVVKQKLKKEQASFRALLNEEKEKQAKHLLSTSDMSITEVAIRMGYTELSGFHKAFVSWTGSSPGDYRR